MATSMEVDGAPLAGTISKIRVENFMCHSHMEVDLIDRVNFITGQNGSGKSAILTALCVAFGSNAKNTNRASTLKDFIKNGCSYALVIVELRNTGDDAFKAELFGPKIIIERRITEGGASTFTLKDSKGRKQLTGRNAVIDVADHFNIDVENPCVIMTQDKSREFLHSGSDKEKFAFFYKATQLEALFETIMDAKNVIEQAQKIGVDQQELLGPWYKQLDDVNSQIQEVEMLEGFQEEIANLKKKEAWAQTFELDKLVAKAQLGLRQAEERLVKVQEKIDKYKGEADEAEGEIAEKRARVPALAARSEELKAKQLALSAQVREVAARKVGAKARLESMHRQIEANRRNVADLQRKIRQTEESILERSKAQSTQYQESILAKEQEVEAAKAEVASVVEEVATINEDLQAVNGPATAARARLEDVKTRHADAQRFVNRLEHGRQNQSSPFGGQKVQKLQQEIERRRHQFSAPPLGPIGAHLSLLEDEWAVAVEVACGSHMDTFVVNSMKDLQILKECGKACSYGQMKIISYSFSNAPYNPSPDSLPRPGLITVKSVLQCNSATIMNVLMDHASVERQVLVKDYNEGKGIAFDRSQRAKECYMMDGTKMWMRGSTQATLPPQRPPHPRLTKNVEGRLASAKEELALIAAEGQRLEVELRNIEENRREINAMLYQANRKRVGAERKVTDLEYDLREILKVADEARGNEGDSGTSELEEAILVLRREEEDAQGPMAEAEAELEQVTEENNQVSATYKAHSAEVTQCGQMLKAVEEELQTLLTTKAQAEHNCAHYTGVRNGAVADGIKQADEALNSAKRERQAAAEKASAYCSEEEINALGGVGTTTNAIAREIRRLTEVYAKQSERCGNTKEELLKRKEILVRRTKKREDTINNLLARTDKLCKHLNYRVQKMRAMVKDKKKELRYRFNMNLQKKGMQGLVKIDTTNKTLQMEVYFPDGANVAVKDTKSLSGGERSFTTLAYALALHDMTDTPFRAMDEFDIFMDAVTRKISLEAVVAHALDPSTDKSQWIFITPHDISSVPASEHVKKQTMHAPRG